MSKFVVLNMIVDGNEDESDINNTIEDSDVNIAIHSLSSLNDSKEEILHVNADDITAQENEFVVTQVISEPNSHLETGLDVFHQPVPSTVFSSMSPLSKTCHILPIDSMDNFKDQVLHNEVCLSDAQIPQNLVQVKMESDFLQKANECSNLFSNGQTFPEKQPNKIIQESSQIVKPCERCALCQRFYHAGKLQNGKEIVIEESGRNLAEVLSSSVDMKVRVSPQVWPICTKCIELLQEADELRRKTNEIKEKLTTLLKHRMTQKKIPPFPFIKESDLDKVHTRYIPDPEPNPIESNQKGKDELPSIDSLDPCGNYEDHESFNWNDSEMMNQCDSEILKPPSSFTNNKTKMACPLCTKEMSKKYWKLHMSRYHTKKEPIICKKCVKSYVNEAYFGYHMVIEHPNILLEEVSYKCDIENKISAKDPVKKLNRQKEKSLCPICNAELNAMYIKRHLLEVHGTEKHYKCKYCEEAFMKQSHRRLHMTKMHGVKYAKLKEINCPHCDKIFRGLGTLKRHIMYTHENIRKYNCPTCSQVLKTRFGLVLHMRSHTDERPYICTICNRAFRRPGSCKKHLKVVHQITVNARLNDPFREHSLPIKILPMKNDLQP